MSDRTSKTILELDKQLQEKRKQAGLEVTPYNYDTTVDKDLAVARSQEVSQEKISDNNKTLVQHALEANAPQVEVVSNDTNEINLDDLKPVSLNTSAIPSQEKNNTRTRR